MSCNAIGCALAGVIVAAGLVRLPVPNDPEAYYFMSQQVIAIMAVYAGLAALLWVKVNRWIAAIFLSAVIGSIFPEYTGPAALAMGAWAAAAVLYYIVFMHGSTRTILNAACWVAIVQFGFQVLQTFGIDPMVTVKVGMAPPGLMTRQGEIAGLMAIAAPAFWRTDTVTLFGLRLPVRWFVLAPLPIIGLALAKSFGGALALSAAVFVVAWMRGHKGAALSGLLVCVLAYLAFDRPESVGMRLQAWKTAIRSIIEHPWFGAGTGNWIVSFPGTCVDWTETVEGGKVCKQIVLWDTAHNDWLQWTYEQGAKFSLLAAGYLMFLARRAATAFRNNHIIILSGCCAACFVSASTHWLFQTGTTAVMATAFFAMLDKETT